MALEAGAQLHYNSKIDIGDADIVACGPKNTSAVAYGEIFNTKHENIIAFQLNDKLAPGAYSYLIVIDGVGLICTCLWRKQKKSERFLNETIAWYQRHYPNIDMEPVKRVGGKGDFTINKHYKIDGKYYVGESGGLQDFMWGFGMRMAIWSGVLAANDILGQGNYEKDVRKQLLPYVRTSIANRWLMNRVGDRTFKRMCRQWMKDQKKSGEGLRWISKLFRPTIMKTTLFYCIQPFMLEKDKTAMSRGVRRMPFRKAKPRDVWEPSEDAMSVKKRWDDHRKKGGHVSFQEENSS
jgi:flavin-dependent dehydrogenase